MGAELSAGRRPPGAWRLWFAGVAVMVLAVGVRERAGLAAGDASSAPWRLAAPDADAALRARMALPWPEALSEVERWRGLTYYGSGLRLAALGRRLLAGQPVAVHMIGGSITAAGKYGADFMTWLNASFPHRGHRLANHAFPASTSSYMAPCFECLPGIQGADLIVVELTLNDRVTLDFDNDDRRAYEALLRKCLRLRRAPPLLLLHSYAWWLSFGDGATEGLFYHRSETQLTTFSSYYDVPSLSVRSAAWRLMHAGVPGFNATRVWLTDHVAPATGAPVPVAKAKLQPIYYYADVIHPASLGFTVLAELMVAAVQRGVADAAGGWQPQERAHPGLAGLPPPMIPRSRGEHTTFCGMQEAFKAVVANHTKGFAYRPERPEGHSFVDQKWGWSSGKPGEWVELRLDTRARRPGLAANATGGGAGSARGRKGGKGSKGGEGGPGGGDADGGAVVGAAQARAYVVRLRSYEGMAPMRLECVGGCRCEAHEVDNGWPHRASIFEAHAFQVTQHARCRVRLTVLPAAAGVKGKVVLTAALVAHADDPEPKAGASEGGGAEPPAAKPAKPVP